VKSKQVTDTKKKPSPINYSQASNHAFLATVENWQNLSQLFGDNNQQPTNWVDVKCIHAACMVSP